MLKGRGGGSPGWAQTGRIVRIWRKGKKRQKSGGGGRKRELGAIDQTTTEGLVKDEEKR